MVMSSKKIGSMVGADVDKALANIGASAPKPDMKDEGTELKAAVAPKKAQTFGEAFRAARKDPEAMKKGVFTFGGKSYTTKLASEGAKRPAATSAPTKKTETPKPTGGVSAATEAMFNRMKAKGIPKMEGYKAPAQNKTATPARPKDTVRTGRGMLSNFFSSQKDELRKATAPARARQAKLDAERESRLAAEKAANKKTLGIRESTPAKPVPKATPKTEAKFTDTAGKPMSRDKAWSTVMSRNKTSAPPLRAVPDKPKAAPGSLLMKRKEEKSKPEYTKGRGPLKVAKGGKIDGCAVRGKTRAGRK